MDTKYQTISQILVILHNQIEIEHGMTVTVHKALRVLNFLHKNSVTDVNGPVLLKTHRILPKSWLDTFLRALLLKAAF